MLAVHLLGAFLCFAFGVLYVCLQTLYVLLRACAVWVENGVLVFRIG